MYNFLHRFAANLKGSNRSQTLNDSQNDSVQLSFPFIKATVHNKFKHVTETKNL